MVWVFVRRAAQTDGVKERLFESAVQEQQKTLPLESVVKNEHRGSIWHVVWREVGATMPSSTYSVPPADHGYMVGEERDKDWEKRGRPADRYKEDGIIY